MRTSMDDDKIRYVVTSVKEESSHIKTLSLAREGGALPEYVCGQYIHVYFPETGIYEGKAYSISSGTDEHTFSITVRSMGEFSRRLCSLVEGECVIGSAPCGFFYPEDGNRPLVLLAGGIGITPFRSILHSASTWRSGRNIYLFHSVRNESEAIFSKEFLSLAQKKQNFLVRYFVTREDVCTLPEAFSRRINAAAVLPYIRTEAGVEALVCGSISFTRDMWRMLRKNGISEEYIYTEAFFSC